MAVHWIYSGFHGNDEARSEAAEAEGGTQDAPAAHPAERRAAALFKAAADAAGLDLSNWVRNVATVAAKRPNK
jgi:hypothetical protein